MQHTCSEMWYDCPWYNNVIYDRVIITFSGFLNKNANVWSTNVSFVDLSPLIFIKDWFSPTLKSYKTTRVQPTHWPLAMRNSEKLPGIAPSNDSAQSPDSFNWKHGDVIADKTCYNITGYINPYSQPSPSSAFVQRLEETFCPAVHTLA